MNPSRIVKCAPLAARVRSTRPVRVLVSRSSATLPAAPPSIRTAVGAVTCAPSETLISMAPAAPVRAKTPVPPSSTSAVPASSRCVAATWPPVMRTVALPVPKVCAKSPTACAPDTVTRPVLIAVASPAFPMVVAELGAKNMALTPFAPNLGSLASLRSPEVSTVPWFSARAEPETSTVPTRVQAPTALAPSPAVVTVAPRSLKARAWLGSSPVPAPRATATTPSAFQPPVTTSPRFRASALPVPSTREAYKPRARLPSVRMAAFASLTACAVPPV